MTFPRTAFESALHNPAHRKSSITKPLKCSRLLHRQNVAYAKTGVEGASTAIASCSVNGLTSLGYSTNTSTTPSFTGEVDGSKFYDTLKTKVSDAETSGNYPLADFAANYCTEDYWSSISWSNYGGVVIPSDSPYATGWYVPSRPPFFLQQELCTNFFNNGRLA